MRFGLSVPQQGIPWSTLVARAKMAERLGFDAVWCFDHLAPGTGREHTTFEGMTTLAGLAQATSRIRLGLLATNALLRSPALLASQVVTVSSIASGRLNVGIGLGWDETEHAKLHLPFPPTPARYEALETTLETLRLTVAPPPGQAALEHFPALPIGDRPPIWVCGAGPRRTLPIAAWYADAWHAYGTPATLSSRMKRLDELALAAGRKPEDIKRASSLTISEKSSVTRRKIEAWRDAGWDYLVCDWPENDSVDLPKFASLMQRYIN